MVVTHYGNQQYYGLSTDTKPVPADTAVNAIFEETDSHDTYINNGTAWVLFSANDKTETLTNKTLDHDSNSFIRVGSYDAIIYKSGTVYKSRKWDGTVLGSSTTLDSVVQAALDVTGHIVWLDAGADFYQPSNAHTGWMLSNDTFLDISPNASIIPSGIFANTLFKIDDNTGGDHFVQRIRMEGGQFVQGGAPSKTWTFMDMTSTSSTSGLAGIQGVTLRNIHVKSVGTFIKLNAPSGTKSYINGNTFEDIWCDYPHEGIVFNQSGPNSSIFRNNFHNVVIQADPAQDNQSQTAMIYGIRDIAGTNNQFYNCKVWDTTASNIACNITNKARDTLIVGGLMCNVPIDWELTQDYGIRTHVIAEPATVGNNTAMLNPFVRKVGVMYGIGTGATNVQGDGLYSGIATAGTISIVGTANGMGKKMATGATINTLARISTPSVPSVRYWNPFYATRLMINQATNQRIFVGFASSTAVTTPTADDPLVSLSGYGLYHSTTSGVSATNWLVARNTGSASSTITNTGIPVVTGTPIYLYVAAYEEGPKFAWRVGTSGKGEHTTTIPGQLIFLGSGNFISNTLAEDKSLDTFGMYLKHGKAEG